MRTTYGLLLASFALLSACTANQTTPSTNDGETTSSAPSMIDESDSSIDAMDSDDNSSIEAMDSADDTSSTPPNAAVRVIEVTSTDWQFSPSTITAKKGEKIVLRIKNAEGKHSFGISELGINVTVNPGETKDIEIPTDTAGTFAFRCMVPCGPGHKEMTGTLVIEE